MRREKRRPMHYIAHYLYDGTVIAAFPIRKPTPKIMKQRKFRIDEDGVCDDGWAMAGKELSDGYNENRFRFQDIIATHLNTRRIIREMVYPYLIKLQRDMDNVRNQLDYIQRLIKGQPDVSP